MFKYPYGNLHGLNLDWFLDQWKKFQNSFTSAFSASSTVLQPDQQPTVEVDYDQQLGNYDFHFGLPANVKPSGFEVGYQASASGTIIPTGPWLASPPIVPAGEYLWSRTRVIYNDNQYSQTYAVSRQGVDGQGSPATTVPVMDGTGATGTSTAFARADHEHPSDTSRIPVTALASADPLMDGTETAGTSTNVAREDHVHPTDTTRASVTDLGIVQGDITALQGRVLALEGDITSKILYFTNVLVYATTGTIATITDADITADCVLVEISFGNQQYIMSNLDWDSTVGTFTLTGTCSTATTANITLAKKDN